VIAFARSHASGTLLTVAPRLVLSLPRDGRSLPRGLQAWNTTHVRVAEHLGCRSYHNLMTGDVVHAAQHGLPMADVFRTCPVAMLWSAQHS
jgi:maltooligosyltrehalose synthase